MSVLGIGNALVDVLSRIETDDYLHIMGLPKGSMQLINESELIKILGIIKQFDNYHAAGGSAANAICGLAQLGISAGFIGKVGQDFYGSSYTEDLIKNKVTPHLLEDNIASGCAMAMISPDGERTFGTYLGAAANLQAEDLTEEMFVGYDFFHIEGYLVQNPALIRRACQLAKAAGSKISLDMASYNVVESNIDFFRELITDYTDIVFANEEEAYAFTGKDPLASAEELASLCEVAVVKIGAKGSIIKRKDEMTTVNAIPANCLDTTGAGDMYASGFLFGMIHNYDLELCGNIGSLLAGKVIEVMGPKLDDEAWDKIKTEVGNLIFKRN